MAETVSSENIIGPSALVLCAYGIRKLWAPGLWYCRPVDKGIVGVPKYIRMGICRLTHVFSRHNQLVDAPGLRPLKPVTYPVLI